MKVKYAPEADTSERRLEVATDEPMWPSLTNLRWLTMTKWTDRGGKSWIHAEIQHAIEACEALTGCA
jgi:hypothetical protein